MFQPVPATAHVAAPNFPADVLASWVKTAHVELESATFVHRVRVGAR